MLRRFSLHLSLFSLSAALFALAFPSYLHHGGLYPLAYIALIPFFIAVNRISWWSGPIWGAFFGFLSYALLNYWLANFHPLAIFIVPVIYAGYFLALVPALQLARHWFPRWGFLVQLVFWMAYEYFRTLGFLGYSYGIIGYSQYQLPWLVRISSVTGVWGVSALVLFPSVLVAWIITGWTGNPSRAGLYAEFRRYRGAAGGYLILMAAVAIAGAGLRVDLQDTPTVRMALVQQNIDPWQGGTRAYRRSLDVLMRESRAALESDPDIELVVWSETSFVPSIDFHRRTRTQLESWELVERLLDFLEDQPVPYVLGNGDRQLRRSAQGDLEAFDYNAVLLMQGREIVQTYRKTHLVPFTEHFPYQRAFPWLYRLLVENDTTFWEQGEDLTVFEAAGIRFSTPICFEDTFGYLNRHFVREGAEVLVNLTNDSWADSVASAMQHMGMAVFRAAETRRSMVRSTNGGMTTLIDPNGQIVDMLPAFVEGHLIVDVPVYTESDTLYTGYGDWFAYLCSIAAAVMLGTAFYRGFRQLTDRRKAVQNK
ncbi:apolipoprotein N-acyltransferase [Spirochaeta africana]|uniref:Apolipoprotein N-acyltransferase n=1 Tax=Spirochaeta africana (strain ATCC 700263 / DSM 8902 / Z-7692) TaxID=889378 RepID=H9UKF0_SPIAZ|nr:apolipoprotein N-acyltransferase [Spirochaeta africana]AFG37993.1 apolipoprotein N-acyltransferase [Spirochaeta africana DSM 8902]